MTLPVLTIDSDALDVYAVVEDLRARRDAIDLRTATSSPHLRELGNARYSLELRAETLSRAFSLYVDALRRAGVTERARREAKRELKAAVAALETATAEGRVRPEAERPHYQFRDWHEDVVLRAEYLFDEAVKRADARNAELSEAKAMLALAISELDGH